MRIFVNFACNTCKIMFVAEDLVNWFTAMALHLNDDTTAIALQHRFRPLKKDAAAMQAGI
jgi:hypothetical protein